MQYWKAYLLISFLGNASDVNLFNNAASQLAAAAYPYIYEGSKYLTGSNKSNFI